MPTIEELQQVIKELEDKLKAQDESLEYKQKMIDLLTDNLRLLKRGKESKIKWYS